MFYIYAMEHIRVKAYLSSGAVKVADAGEVRLEAVKAGKAMLGAFRPDRAQDSAIRHSEASLSC